MAKDKSFAAKLAKAAGAGANHCPKCGELYDPIQVVETIKSDDTDSYKFRASFVSLCKCNQNILSA